MAMFKSEYEPQSEYEGFGQVGYINLVFGPYESSLSR